MAFGNATKGYVKSHSGGGGGGGTTNYSELSNKPQINGVTLDGNKTSEELGIIGGGGGADFSSATLWKTNPTDSDSLPLSNVTQYVAVVICSHYSDGDIEYDIHIIPKFLLDVMGVGKFTYIYYFLDDSKYVNLQKYSSDSLIFTNNTSGKRVYVYYK